MTHIFSRRAVIGAILASPFVTPSWAATQTFVLDKKRSEVRFSYDLDGAQSHSSISVSDAEFKVDLADLSRSDVAVSLDPRTVKSGFFPATEALKSPDLLDAVRFPLIRFEASQIRPSGAGGFVTGDLTIKGVTRSEQLVAQFINEVPSTDATEFGLQISGQVDRHAYGVSGFSSFVGPTVSLRIRAYLTRS